MCMNCFQPKINNLKLFLKILSLPVDIVQNIHMTNFTFTQCVTKILRYNVFGRKAIFISVTSHERDDLSHNP